jgi:hypothetical protein
LSQAMPHRDTLAAPAPMAVASADAAPAASPPRKAPTKRRKASS